MLKVLVFGATGLLGHKLMQELPRCCHAIGTTQRLLLTSEHNRQLNSDCMRFAVDVRNFQDVLRVIHELQPAVIVNCAGIVKSLFTNVSTEIASGVNTEFPLKLAEVCEHAGIRFIHISTDCVFSGKRGQYLESDIPDPVDAYGRSKLMGEPQSPACLTLRTSFIGRECGTSNGLIEWLYSQRGNCVRGFRQAVFSGMTTLVLARLVSTLICEHTELRGTWHVAAGPINKYSLLKAASDRLRLDVEIFPDDAVVCDRSLNGQRFRNATGFTPPSWDDMLDELAIDAQKYD